MSKCLLKYQWVKLPLIIMPPPRWISGVCKPAQVGLGWGAYQGFGVLCGLILHHSKLQLEREPSAAHRVCTAHPPLCLERIIPV